MEGDGYQVKVIHYLNPYLIWIEVISGADKSEFIFEQIGLYGLLPLDKNIDIINGVLKSERCSSWAPATAALMKRVLSESEEVWFVPIYIDRKSSIFDSNVHKYGEILVKKFNGKYKKLSRYIEKSGFGLNDSNLFIQELTSGKLNIKLDHYDVQDIFLEMKKYGYNSVVPLKQWETCLRQQMTVFFAAQRLSAELTVENLERHNNVMQSAPRALKDKNLCALLDSKLKDFVLCKDLDDVSMGRATSRKPKSLLLKEKMQLIGSQNEADVVNENDPVATSNATEGSSTPNQPKAGSSKSSDTKQECNNEELGTPVESFDETKTTDEYDSHPIQCSQKKMYLNLLRKSKKGKKSKTNKIPDYNMEREKRIAIGPAGMSIKHLCIKVVPKVEPKERLVLHVEEEEEPTESRPHNLLADEEESENEFFMNTNVSQNISNNGGDKFVQTQHKIMTNDKLHKKTESPSSGRLKASSKLLQRKLELISDKSKNVESSSSSSNTTNKDSSSSVEEFDVNKGKQNKKNNEEEHLDEHMIDINEKLEVDAPVCEEESVLENEGNMQDTQAHVYENEQVNHVNPFRNIDESISVFVDKLVTPVLMVHTKNKNRIVPRMYLRDIPFTPQIQSTLKTMNVTSPMRIQSVSWYTILRGYSVFMISPAGTGKTLGYVPAICRLLLDGNGIEDSTGPKCIIVCATARSVVEVEKMCKRFLGLGHKIFSCYAGINELNVITSLLNGCDLFICTPSVLARLLQRTDYGIDLSRLSIVVFEDCERLANVYINEIKFFLYKIKDMLKKRVKKELAVQFVVASRVWCDFMEPLAKRAPNTVICIGAFEECIRYSKLNTTVKFLNSNCKINAVLQFVKEIDITKKTVIVCRTDDEVKILDDILTSLQYQVFSCNYNMTIEDLYNMNTALAEYKDRLLGPILVCCDGNLAHLNVTDAHNLCHYSLPYTFSMFRKRFSVLNNNYASIFATNKENVKLEILLDENNVEELPKIQHFIKRCFTTDLPKWLVSISDQVFTDKEFMKAINYVPICENLLSLGTCPDIFYCKERHAFFKEYDKPKDWMPKNGEITFKILHYHSPVSYSARLISHIKNDHIEKYHQNYSTLSLKMGMYYSKEANRKLHGTPKLGDICAVSIKENFFVRCQVVKIINNYQRGNPNHVLVKLIDEEKYEITRDIYLYYLPVDLKNIETHVVLVRLANLQPKDKDITFSDLARDDVKKIIEGEENLYMNGRVVVAIGNCIFIDTMEACEDLTSLKEKIVKHNIKEELLNVHAIPNPDHLSRLKAYCIDVNVKNMPDVRESSPNLPEGEWSCLENNEIVPVYMKTLLNPDLFFVCLANSCTNNLRKDIDEYVSGLKDKVLRMDIYVNNLVLAKSPNDFKFHRAKIEYMSQEQNKVGCFFLDEGYSTHVSLENVYPITENIITQLPFQCIPCRLIGVKPPGDSWTEFAKSWFSSQFSDATGKSKCFYVKYFTKEPAERTGLYKYGVAVIDISSEKAIVTNQLMIDLNLAKQNEDEIEYLQNLNFDKYPAENLKENNVDNDDSEKPESNEPVIYESHDNSGTSKSVETKELSPMVSNIPPTQPIEKDIVTNQLMIDLNLAKQNEDEIEYSKNLNFDKYPTENLEENNVDNDDSEKPEGNEPLIYESRDNSDTSKLVETKELSPMVSNIPLTQPIRSIPLVASDDDYDIDDFDINIMGEFTHIIRPLNQRENSKSPLKALINSVHESPIENEELKVQLSPIENSSPDSGFEIIAPLKNTLEQLDSENSTPESMEQNDSTATAAVKCNAVVIEEDIVRKPKLIWYQNKTSVTIKIMLIGVDKYFLTVNDKFIKFDTILNDIHYGFEFQLYGVIDHTKTTHSSKGQYILVHLTKLLNRNWLTLTRDGNIRRWIVYDVNYIDTSSDEEEDTIDETFKNNLKDMNTDESESDNSSYDDINYGYRRN